MAIETLFETLRASHRSTAPVFQPLRLAETQGLEARLAALISIDRQWPKLPVPDRYGLGTHRNRSTSSHAVRDDLSMTGEPLDVSAQEFADRLSQLIYRLEALAEDEAQAEDSAIKRVGLPRVMQAVRRLRLLPHFHDLTGDRSVFDRQDRAIMDAFVDSVEALLKPSEWPVEMAFSLASQIENQVAKACSDALFSDSFGPSDDLIQTRHDATAAQANIDLEKHLLRQRAEIDLIMDDAKQAAGITADSELATAFSSYEKSEKEAADRYRWGAILVLVLIGILSLYSARNIPSSWSGAVAHLGIAASGLAAFGYLARESSQHRGVARATGVMAVQLKTLGAFSRDMSAEQRELLRAEFGRRVFAELPSMADGKVEAADLAPTVQAVHDLVKVVRGMQ